MRRRCGQCNRIAHGNSCSSRCSSGTRAGYSRVGGVKARSGQRDDVWKVDLHAGRVAPATYEEYSASDLRIEMPAILLKQALRMNMFSQTGISKRVKWLATKQSMKLLSSFMQLLDFEEYAVLPLHRNLTWRSLRVWARRWREVLGYGQLIWIMKSRKINGKEVEQVALLEFS